ncbi:acetyl-CoA carboxylase biotin carboxylase subunit [Actinosynnema sp. NPDC020468]|uniref:acetyl-CoA carboxylase biotin carboxylase subunit n=1 Tax=Actinosynnema sp. NPDC020468 TaxID=3154488 RepID=UPI0033E7CCE7
MIRKVLIANRGEIALRVARTCRELGIGTVAVYSESDRDSAVVRFADESVNIGPGPAKQSYLNIPAVIEAARTRGADAIHPGYGFLSENPDFAEVCEAEGITFVGTPAKVMAQLGDKASARAIMTDAGLPLLPGSRDALDGPAAHALAEEIGYPVIVKAVAGGGGRGMAVIRRSEDFARAWAETRAAAQAVFRDGRMYVERYLDSARHVEIQVLADAHGSVVHLGARDCSLQRRHQKLVEESPAPNLPSELLAEMGEAAVRGAREAGYVGAGTFEFLVDGQGRFYFMEVNCRLQVEHPVTEMVTGVDLVAEQLRIAAGEPLSFGQDDIRHQGVSIECRINAEDPSRAFAPAPGTLVECLLPGGPFVRVDTHAHTGYRVPALYDSLLAKVIVWAPTRDAAIARMRRALAETRITGAGVSTTAEFLSDVLDRAEFREVRHHTRFLETLT